MKCGLTSVALILGMMYAQLVGLAVSSAEDDVTDHIRHGIIGWRMCPHPKGGVGGGGGGGGGQCPGTVVLPCLREVP